MYFPVVVATVGQPNFYRAQVRSAGPAFHLSASSLVHLPGLCPVYFLRTDAALQRMVMHLSPSLVCGKHHSLNSG